MIKCAFCGLEYAPDKARKSCGHCPLESVCAQPCCPHCGYVNSTAPKWLESLRSRLRKSRTPTPVGIPISDGVNGRRLDAVEPGLKTRITQIRSKDKSIPDRLLSLGLLPGAQLTVLQRFPTFLLQLGYVQIAIDEQLAQAIHVQVIEPELSHEHIG